MQTRRLRYTGCARGQEVSPALTSLESIEIYVRGLIEEVNTDLKDLNDVQPASIKYMSVKARLLSKKSAYKDVLQYIKEYVREGEHT